jgi:hypothetical protein
MEKKLQLIYLLCGLYHYSMKKEYIYTPPEFYYDTSSETVQPIIDEPYNPIPEHDNNMNYNYNYNYYENPMSGNYPPYNNMNYYLNYQDYNNMNYPINENSQLDKSSKIVKKPSKIFKKLSKIITTPVILSTNLTPFLQKNISVFYKQLINFIENLNFNIENILLIDSNIENLLLKLSRPAIEYYCQRISHKPAINETLVKHLKTKIDKKHITNIIYNEKIIIKFNKKESYIQYQGIFLDFLFLLLPYLKILENKEIINNSFIKDPSYIHEYISKILEENDELYNLVLNLNSSETLTFFLLYIVYDYMFIKENTKIEENNRLIYINNIAKIFKTLLCKKENLSINNIVTEKLPVIISEEELEVKNDEKELEKKNFIEYVLNSTSSDIQKNNTIFQIIENYKKIKNFKLNEEFFISFFNENKQDFMFFELCLESLEEDYVKYIFLQYILNNKDDPNYTPPKKNLIQTMFYIINIDYFHKKSRTKIGRLNFITTFLLNKNILNNCKEKIEKIYGKEYLEQLETNNYKYRNERYIRNNYSNEKIEEIENKINNFSVNIDLNTENQKKYIEEYEEAYSYYEKIEKNTNRLIKDEQEEKYPFNIATPEKKFNEEYNSESEKYNSESEEYNIETPEKKFNEEYKSNINTSGNIFNSVYILNNTKEFYQKKNNTLSQENQKSLKKYTECKNKYEKLLQKYNQSHEEYNIPITQLQLQRNEYLTMYEKYKTLYEELKKTNQELEQKNVDTYMENQRYKEENIVTKKEFQQLKKELAQLKIESEKQLKEFLRSKQQYRKTQHMLKKEKDGFLEENEKLKVENQKLQEENEKLKGLKNLEKKRRY